MLIETCLEGEAIIRATVNSVRTKLEQGFLSLCVNCIRLLRVISIFFVCFLTFGRHGSLCSDDIRVTSEVLQRSDGALTHHRLPAKWTVVDHLQHNGRCVHLILWKELDEGCRENVSKYTISTSSNFLHS